MRAFFDKYGFGIFWTVALIDFLFISLDLTPLRYITKPLLVPLLACTLFSKVEFEGHTTSKLLVLGSMIAATAGDIILLSENGFTGGLICFLIALLLYTIYFFTIQGVTSRQVIPIVMVSAILLSGFSLIIASLWNYLDGYKVPLIIYSLFLLALMVSAINIFYNAESKPLAIDAFIPGAALFVISDVMLATNKFYFEEPFLDLAIMATYCGAQYYICRGCMKELRRKYISENKLHEEISASHQQFNLN